MLFLIAAGIVLRAMIITIDPFIWLWDEQFHALVSKNMMNHPFKPTLYENPLLTYDYRAWDSNHIWLHKQPLFLWQMALSQKIFGASEWAMRLPSAVMSVLLIPVIYRMGLISISREVGFYAAFFASFSFLYTEIASGSIAGDHNDVAFLFYVTLSLWAWMEYTISGKTKWIYLIGLFSGCALLVKWLPGLLVYSGWGISQLTIFRKISLWKWIKPFLIAIGITAMVAVPWWFYCYFTYPKEFSWELFMYQLHFSIPVEGHGGDWTYHFTQLPFLYGEVVSYLLLPALLILIISIKNNLLRVGISAFVLVTFVFYTLSLTKMPYFTIIVSSFFMLALGCSLDFLFKKILKMPKNWMNFSVAFMVMMLVGVTFLKIPDLEKRHTDIPGTDAFRADRIEKTTLYKKIIASIQEEKYIFFNCHQFSAPVLMYYSGMPAYESVPGEKEIEQIIKKGYEVYVFDNGNIPEYVKENSSVRKL